MHLVDPGDGLAVELAAVEEDVPLLDRGATADGVGERPRLLVDLLVHEMLVAVLLGHGGSPVDAADAAGELVPRAVGQLDALLGDDREIPLFEEDHVARMRQDGWHVARDEVALLPQPEDERRGVLRHHQHLRGALAHHRQRVGPLHLGKRRAHRLGQPLSRLLLVGDQVGEDLGIGLRAELVSGAGERLLQLEMVLDDPVVHHGHAAVLVRVRIFIRRLAVGCPPRVPDAGHPARHLLLALGADDGQPLSAEDRHPRRIVAPVLELAQPVHQQGRAILLAHVSNDPAHALPPPLHPDAHFLPFFSTQPSMLRCFPALTARDPAGTSSRTVVPLPT